ncbi:MAG: hypothetical protein K6A43_06505 [Treponema sp.]|nr:hypothetical protein [Treponema sp.]
MVLYILTIVLAMVGIFLYNFFVNPADYSLTKNIIFTILQPIIMIAWDGLWAFIVHWILPGKWFSADSKFVDVGKKECRFYEFLGIKHWKDHVLELGFLGGFSKKKVSNPNDPEYIKLFIQECNVGSTVHLVNLIFAFPILFCFPHNFSIYFVLPAACVNAFLSLLPIMVLRYNIPRLRRLYAVLIKKANRQANLQNQINPTNQKTSQTDS